MGAAVRTHRDALGYLGKDLKWKEKRSRATSMLVGRRWTPRESAERLWNDFAHSFLALATADTNEQIIVRVSRGRGRQSRDAENSVLIVN